MKRYDIFCTVIDNYGDAAVSWRLARQLSDESGVFVRLWIDDLNTLAALVPEVLPDFPNQFVKNIHVCQFDGDEIDGNALSEPNAPITVIAAFGCRLPASYLTAMAAMRPAPRWINLEYLSAESWVESCHLLPSPHPKLPITQTFYFPGFTETTGGLLRERDLIQRRDAFQNDPAAQHEFWQQLGCHLPQHAIKISLFGYAHAPLCDTLHAWAQSTETVCCIIPHSPLAQVAQTLPAWVKQKLHLQILPFLNPADYDRLLWACDANFVRGEDSLVRALWAGRPVVWNIYPQEENAHATKLDAFLERQLACADPSTSNVVRNFARTWNGLYHDQTAALAWLELLPTLRVLQGTWSDELSSQPDLVTRLGIDPTVVSPVAIPATTGRSGCSCRGRTVRTD